MGCQNQIKPDLVILEGADKSGKSTIYQAFRKETNYQPLVIDRFIGSNIVFDQLYTRATLDDIDKYYQIEKKLSEIFNPLLVYLHAPVAVLLKRSQISNELWDEQYDIRNIGWYYEKYLDNTSLEILTINTRTYTLDQCVEIIINKLKERKK